MPQDEIDTIEDIKPLIETGSGSATALRLRKAQASQEKLVKEQGSAPVRFAKGAGAGAGMIAKDIGTAVGVAADPLFKAMKETTQAEFEQFRETGEQFSRSERSAVYRDSFNTQMQLHNDSDWNPRNNPAQAKIQDDEIARIGVDPNGKYARDIRGSTSSFDTFTIAARIESELQELHQVASYGVAGIAGFMAGGLIDVDSALGFGIFKSSLNSAQAAKLTALQESGTLSAKEAQAMTFVNTRLGNIGRATVAGTVSSAVMETTLSAVNPVYDLQDAGASIMLSAGMAGTLGGFARVHRLTDVADHLTASRMAEAMRTQNVPEAPQRSAMEQRDTNLTSYRENMDQAIEIDFEGSVGSARVKKAEVFNSEAEKNIIDASHNFLESDSAYITGIRDFTDFVEETANPVQRGIQKTSSVFYDGLNKIGLAPDFDRNIRSGNAVLQSLAIQLQTSPVGQIVNHSSGDNIADEVYKRTASMYAPEKNRLLLQWAKETGVNSSDIAIPRSGDALDFANPLHHAAFSKDVQLYMARKRVQDPRADQAPDSVKEMGDNLNNTYKNLIREHKRAGTEDFEDIPETDWYFKHGWNAEKLRRAENQIGTKQLVRAIEKGIRTMSPDVPKEFTNIWAMAILQSTKTRSTGNPVGSLGVASEDGIGHLITAIETQGLDKSLGTSAKELANKILYQDSERGKIKSARRRIDIDLTQGVDGTDMTLLDLLDNDVLGHTDLAVRGQSAEIGRLRGSGIQRRDIPMYRRAVEAEAQNNGADPAKHAKLFDSMMSQFTEGAFNGGINRNVGRINKATTLSFMSQVGLPSFGELGLTIGAGGVRGMESYLGKSFKGIFKGVKDDNLLNSLSHSDVYRSPQELFTTSADLDDVASMDTNQLGKVLDSSLDLGARAMSHVSGGYAMHKFTQVYAMKTSNMLMYDLALNPKGLSERRLLAYGVDPEIKRIAKENQQHFTLDENGGILDNGFANWENIEDADLWRRAIARQTDWLVQTTRRGESHAWAHTDIGSLFTRLRSFALNALHSKAIRAGRLADRQTASEFLAQLGTAAIAYSAKQALNGNFDRLGPEDIARGALNWSAQVSPILMLIDPLAYYAGADYFAGAGLHSEAFKRRDFGALPMPAAGSAVSAYAEMMRTPADLIDDGKLDWKTANALRAFPIVGRMYGVNLIIDQMR